MKKLFTAAAAVVVGALALASFASADTGNPTVFVGAHTGFDRTYNWTVTKTDNVHGSVTVAQGEDFSVGYTVTVSQGTPPYTDSNWSVQDGIVLTNPFGLGLTALTDVTASADQGGTITNGSIEVCATDSRYQNPVSFPYNGTLVGCHYVIALPNGSSGTVTATFQGVSASTPFDFVNNLDSGQPRVFNDQITVTDTLGGTLGTLSAPQLHPTVYTYPVPVDTSHCGSYDMPNTASVLDGHGTSLAHASDTVHVTVTCPHVNGCTLTQGYWKTHSIYGPAAKPDPTWNLLSNGPLTSFFSSGQTWLQVFNTSPAGNAYYVLAHQYEAAVLNQLDGASSTAAVNAALATAVSFFNKYTPAQAGALSSSNADRKAALAAAATLDNYNNGLIGPGHCSE